MSPTREERAQLIRELQALRGDTVVITYITSTRANLEVQMAVDAIPVIYEHLRRIKTPKNETNIDLFIHSNGGEGTVPWRLITLIREYCQELTVLVPHRAFSAATLTAMGADKVIMHPMGMLGPTDPSVTTPFNPTAPNNPAQLLDISVEDVASYINLVKEDVGIRHEDELVQAFKVLAEKVHPLALGTVKRSTSQSRMMGEKLLGQRTRKLAQHEEAEIIDKLTSRLYYHGHPINRREARDDLGLEFVEDASGEVEKAIWKLYEAYENLMNLNREFQPVQDVLATGQVSLPPAPQMAGPGQYTTTDISRHNIIMEPIVGASVQSSDRSDVYEIVYDATLRREWTGEVQAQVFPRKTGWTEEGQGPSAPQA